MPDREGHATAESLRQQLVALNKLVEEAERLRAEVTAHLQSLRRAGDSDHGVRPSGVERRKKPRMTASANGQSRAAGSLAGEADQD